MYAHISWEQISVSVPEFMDRLHSHPLYEPLTKNYEFISGRCYDHIWLAALAMNCTDRRLIEMGQYMFIVLAKHKYNLSHVFLKYKCFLTFMHLMKGLAKRKYTKNTQQTRNFWMIILISSS